ncbi:hypothetical protein ACWE42_12205 [Sutcliffiella cohnii]
MKQRVNIMRTLGITYKEDVISNLLVTLLNESNFWRHSFLKEILQIENPNTYRMKSYTRVTTSVGVPDIVSVVEKEDVVYLLLIENKLKADEGYRQTIRYASDECINDLKCHFELQNRKVETKLLYLTLVPETIPTSSSFLNISYEQLIQKVPPSEIEDIGLKMLYEDFVSVLTDFYTDLDLKEDDRLLEKFKENTEAERLKIRFRKLMDSIQTVETGLTRSEVGQVVGSGRINFLVQFSKDAWKGKVAEKGNGLYKLTSDTFDIHIECTFDVFNQIFSLPLHYETRPYLTKRNIKWGTEGYEQYDERREKVKSFIHKRIKELNDPTIRIFNGSNQIANVKINLTDETTVKEFKESLNQAITKISILVDAVLEKENV